MVDPSDSALSRILVTGAGGFTGRHVADELQRAGHAVYGLARRAESVPHGVVAVPADMLDGVAIREAVAAIRPTAVVHLAAIAFVAHGEVEDIYRANIIGTRHLLAALAALPSPPERVLLASSANVYGNAGGREDLLDERVQPAPANDYAVSKLAMEYMARTWRNRLPITVARPFNYTGVGQHPRFLVPKIVDHFRRRTPRIALGNLDVWREFMDVRMVAWVYRRLLETTGIADTFNICTGQVHSLRQVLEAMAAIAGYAIEIEVNPEFVRRNEVRRLGGDPSLLRQRVGAPPTFELTETLRWMYQA
jgi:nucleoside-diphosphate-sugar epimerase